MASREPAQDEELELIVFHDGPAPSAEFVPGGRWRDWMNATDERVANRCLPLLMANQSGWVLLNPAPFTATWEGGNAAASLTVEYPSDVPEVARLASSHFGHGIVSFEIRELIRTPPGYNLLARGPTNAPKDGVYALDGLIETDWSAALFSMNWKLTRPGTVSFAENEPFCQILPQRRGELERFRTEFREMSSEDGLTKRVKAWAGVRALARLGKIRTFDAGDDKWSRIWMTDYFKGTAPTGESSPEHQTTLQLCPFEREPGDNAD